MKQITTRRLDRYSAQKGRPHAHLLGYDAFVVSTNGQASAIKRIVVCDADALKLAAGVITPAEAMRSGIPAGHTLKDFTYHPECPDPTIATRYFMKGSNVVSAGDIAQALLDPGVLQEICPPPEELTNYFGFKGEASIISSDERREWGFGPVEVPDQIGLRFGSDVRSLNSVDERDEFLRAALRLGHDGLQTFSWSPGSDPAYYYNEVFRGGAYRHNALNDYFEEEFGYRSKAYDLDRAMNGAVLAGVALPSLPGRF